MPVKVTSVRVGGSSPALLRVPAAKDSDSSHGRAIDTPSPRSSVRREKVEAGEMGMGMFLWWRGVDFRFDLDSNSGACLRINDSFLICLLEDGSEQSICDELHSLVIGVSNRLVLGYI